MRRAAPCLATAMVVLCVASVAAQQVPSAIYTDPPHDERPAARMEVLHIPSGGVTINGLAYLAAGAGLHPTLVLLHGHPGYEKNLDLAQAVRRAGWNVVTFDYRGAWGSPGVYRLAHNLEDADAVLAYVRQPAVATSLGIDTTRLVLGGHSNGGWVTMHTAAHDHRLAGVILISAGDVGLRAMAPRDSLLKGSMDGLAGVTPEILADEMIANAERWRNETAYDGLSQVPLLVTSADDGTEAGLGSLVSAVRARGNTRVTTLHFATDHSYSDRRIALQDAVIRWLGMLTK